MVMDIYEKSINVIGCQAIELLRLGYFCAYLNNYNLYIWNTQLNMDMTKLSSNVSRRDGACVSSKGGFFETRLKTLKKTSTLNNNQPKNRI